MNTDDLDTASPESARDDFFAILATAALLVALLAGVSTWLGGGVRADAAPDTAQPVAAATGPGAAEH